MDLSTLTLWTGPFPVKGVSGKFSLLPRFTEIPVHNAKNPDSVASDLDLHCLPMSILRDDRRKWVKKELALC